jgi:hypothetical protein
MDSPKNYAALGFSLWGRATLGGAAKSVTLKTGIENVTVTIDLPEPVLAALEAQALAAHCHARRI